MASNVSIPKGTRDFSPAVMRRRQYIFDTIKDVFELYGFGALETPAMENLSTLTGKYGDEGDKLLFRIQNSGEQAANPPEKGLRYDLTVPFARYVVQHHGELTFPFKRYQIQPVWRADRPQKGRYREFYQCDVDVIGTRSLLCEVELIQIVEEVFRRLGIRVVLKMNNRKILAGIAEAVGCSDRIVDLTVALDKLDKIGVDAVKEELAAKGISAEALEVAGDTSRIALTEIGAMGVQEVETILEWCKRLGVTLPIELDFSLARGLNYYTGAIFEVKAADFEIGSICGGGRYDDLTGVFGLPNMSGVGISFGADRIYDVMDGLGLFPAEETGGVRVMLTNLGEAEEQSCMLILNKLRGAGVAAEIYPEAAKMKKQMEYANRRGVPFVAIVGSDELAEGVVTLKNMTTGEQKKVTPDELIHCV